MQRTVLYILLAAILLSAALYASLTALLLRRMEKLRAESAALRDMAYTDLLTGLGNRNAYELCLKELSARCPPEELSCIVADINGLKGINDELGHTVGDAAIIGTGRVISALTGENGECFRTGGDEFVVLLPGVEQDAQKLAAAISEACAEGEGGVVVELAVGLGSLEAEDGDVRDFIRRVDCLMYEDKRRLKNR